MMMMINDDDEVQKLMKLSVVGTSVLAASVRFWSQFFDRWILITSIL